MTLPSAFAAATTLSQSAELAAELDMPAADDPLPVAPLAVDPEVAALEVEVEAVDPLLPQAVSTASAATAPTATIFVRDFIDTANFH